MVLAAGSLLGPYRVESLLGAGGMGEVYLARDTRLGRTVALKLLHSRFSENDQMRKRLEHEAQAVSHLSHPNICTLYDIGDEKGKLFLVMEYIEGENLATVLSRRRLSLEEVLRYGMQIAGALDKAHRTGIIHRDLKPGNILITKTGVKLLDFGLAKSYTVDSSPLSTNSTMPTAENLTIEGTILGTLQYMAPEQLEGKKTDSCSDIFALGVVLYEMLTQRSAFSGNSQSNIIAAILTSEVPPVSATRSPIPPQLDHIVAKCLEKNREDRWQSALDVKHELKWIEDNLSKLSASPGDTIPKSRKWMVPVILAIGLVSVSAYFAARNLLHRQSGDTEPYALSVSMPINTSLSVDYAEIALSPDARRLVFVALDENNTLYLWLRELRSLETRKLQGTAGALSPFWSPNSQWIAFFSGGKLKKIKITESEAETLCNAGTGPGGGAWNRGGILLFAPGFEGPLYTISENGGTAKQVTTLNATRGDTNHLWPQFLPDQRHFIVHVSGLKGPNGVYIGSLDSSELKPLLVTSSTTISIAQFAPPNYLVYVQNNVLMAQHFDPDRRDLSGVPVRIVQGVSRLPWLTAFFSVSEKDILAFRSNVSRAKTQLVWLDRKGAELQRIGQPQSYESFSLSPDNRRAVVARWESTSARNIWLIDLLTGIETKFSFGSDDGMGVWAPQGDSIVFFSARETPPNLYLKYLSDTEKEDRLFTSDLVNFPTSWSPDGRYILYSVRDLETNYDIFALDLKQNRKQIVLVKSNFEEKNARFSPDGNWFAYESNETGRFEIYVKAFGHSGERTLVSNQGGYAPFWKKDGKELFYLDLNDRMMSVQVQSGTSLEFGLPQPLFQAPKLAGFFQYYAVSNDGNRFLFNTLSAQQPEPPPIHILIHWSRVLD